MVEKLIIIGSGPAGYTAGLYASRAMFEPLLFAGYASGGQLMLTSDVENYPGYPEGIQGPEMMMQLRAQAERFGTRILDRNVDSVDLSHRPFGVTSGDESWQAEALIIATGAEAIWLGVENEEVHKGRGISTCATCLARRRERGSAQGARDFDLRHLRRRLLSRQGSYGCRWRRLGYGGGNFPDPFLPQGDDCPPP